ncbi:MAG: alpha/beta hydrolase [Thermoprotei archaeon]
MPVDPEIRRLLKFFEEKGFASSESSKLDVTQMRSGFLELSKLVPRENVASVKDFNIEYGDGVVVPCRLYTPEAEAGGGLVVYLHGGGFVLGGIEEYDGLCRALCNASKTKILSVGYRLAPEHRFPAAVEDAVAALEYSATHTAELGVHPGKLVVAGDSAGGNLAAVAATLTKGKVKLRRQVLVYPTVSFDVSSYSHVEYSSDLFLTGSMMGWFGRLYLSKPTDVLDPRFSPMLFEDLRSLPPTLIVTAEYDPLRDQGEAFGAKLAEQGVPVSRVRVGGMIHGFLSFFGVLKPARDTLTMIGALISADTHAEA